MSGFSAGANAFLNSPYKERLFAPNPATERGAATIVNAHPKEPRIIYPSGKFVVVRNVMDPGDSFIYRGHAFPVTVAKFSPNGYWVASADEGGKIRVWSWDNPEHLTKLEATGLGGGIYDLDWDPESKKIVLAGSGSGIMIKCITWDTGNSVGEMVGHSKKILSCTYRPVRPFRIASCGEDMKVQFYAGPPFKMEHSMTTVHSNFVNCIRFSPDGSLLATVGSDKKIQLYDGKTGEPTREVKDAHAGGVYSLAWSPDSKSFLTASGDKTVKLWNAETLACEETFTFAEDAQVGDMQVAVVWSPHFPMMSLSLNGNINFLSRASPAAPEKVLQGHQVAITCKFINRTSKSLYTGSFDGVVCVRNLDGAGDAVKIKGTDPRIVSNGAHAGKVVGMSVVTGDLVSVGWDDKMRFGNRTQRAYQSEVPLVGQPVTMANCTPATDLILIVTTEEVALYRGQEKLGSTSNAELGFTPKCGALWQESEVALGGSDFKTHIYQLNGASLTPVTTIETRSAVSALAYSPNGDTLAIGDEGRQVEIYDRTSWTAVVKGKWVFHTSKITCLSWSPKGKYLASGGLDENIIVWNMADVMNKVQIPFAHMGGVTGVGWLDIGKLVSVGNDHATVTWNIPVDEA